jgi:hypothetical protein
MKTNPPKMPYPGNLNAIELAVWAAEYVRVHALPPEAHQLAWYHPGDQHSLAVKHANDLVAELRHHRQEEIL